MSQEDWVGCRMRSISFSEEAVYVGFKKVKEHCSKQMKRDLQGSGLGDER